MAKKALKKAMSRMAKEQVMFFKAMRKAGRNRYLPTEENLHGRNSKNR